MPFLRRVLAWTVLLIAATALPGYAQERGSISGKVYDKKTGHALPFATVTVMGAQKGGLTDSEGQYVVNGVPPGTYEVKVQFLGYAPISKPGVVVAPGKPTSLDFQLEEIVVRQEKVVEVTAERRLVEVRQGATVRSVNSAEIRNLPVATVGEVLQQQAGISTDADQIHVRGGRSDETIFMVNGVANRDLVTGAPTAGTINARSVQEVNVATGAYDVRYGNALSGVVEIRLKDGTDKFQGGLTTTAGSYGGRAIQLVAGGPDPVIGGLVRALGGKPGQINSILDVSGALYDTRFYAFSNDINGPWQTMFGSYVPSNRQYDLVSSYKDAIFGHKFRYGPFFGQAPDNQWGLRYGVNWKPNTRDRWAFNMSKRINIDQGFSRTIINATGDAGDPAYPWIWHNNLAHANTFLEDNVQLSAEWRRTLSTTSFTQLQFSRNFSAQRIDVQGKSWQDYQKPDDSVFPPGDPRRNDYFYDTGDDNLWQDRRSNSYALNWLMVQRFKRHELEFGLTHEFQGVQFVTIQDPWDEDPSGLGSQHDLWDVHPWVGAFYVRDQLEYEGFSANLGLRADYWFVGREAELALSDTTNHNFNAANREDFYNDTNSFFGRRYKLRWSPRIIVAHPITDRSSFFFNYGRFTQLPQYRLVYAKMTSVSGEAFPLQGNPDLNPQVSVNYELGAKSQFTDKSAVNVSFFVKDVYDYPRGVQLTRAEGAVPIIYSQYVSGSFARSKGIEIEMERRRSNFWSGKVTFTFQQTKGKDSDPSEIRAIQLSNSSAADVPLSEQYVTWSRPFKVTTNFDLRYDEQAPRNWMKNCGLNVYLQGESGRAYTPATLTSDVAGETNSKNGPFQITTDIRLNHVMRFGAQRFDLSLTGTNIFNNRLVYRVDRVTGEQRMRGVGEYDPSRPGDLLINDPNTLVQLVDDPSNLGPGAQYRISLDYDF
ncbi:MAG TPA: TonB-dependent receptor [Candidatus Sulfotelmatobacter sp.]|nr:TonB-dependent receptor [Candidatus Sulfotelmatobacter sp.]